MAKIQVKYDPTLEQSEIIARLDNSSPDEEGAEYNGNQTAIQQTSVYGLQCPIIAVNDIMIAYEDIIDFELDDSGHVPSVSLHVYDRKSLIQYLDVPRNDNELRIQILPPFDDVYKKINLTFFISNYSIGDDNDLYITGNYKLSGFTSSQFKAFGEVSLYDLFDKIASETKLGFASNVEGGDDKRYVYCPYTSYQSAIEREIKHSGDKTIIYDWWIDVWNYLTLENVYERYNDIDSEEDMEVWVDGSYEDITEGWEYNPVKVPAEMTNIFGSEQNQLYVKDYRIVNNPGANVGSGTDKLYSVYSMNDRKYTDTYISDGDVKKDTYNKFEYLGEVYGDYDYVTHGMFRDAYLQKINNNLVEIDLAHPLLGLIRGNRLVFACYYNDDNVDYPVDGLQEAGLIEDIQTNVPIMEPDYKGSDMFKLDKSISGQYLIMGNKYKFSNYQWTQTVILARPMTQTPLVLDNPEDETPSLSDSNNSESTAEVVKI